MRSWLPHRFAGRAVSGALVLALIVGCALAVADTVYLKNGRVLWTSTTRQEGGRLFIEQYGQEIAIPMHLVERVVLDEENGPTPLPSGAFAPATVDEEPAGEGDEESASETSVESTPAAGDTESEIEAEDTNTPEYWRQRVEAVRSEEALLRSSLEELRREERAFLFSHRSTATSKDRISEVEDRLEALRQEMRDLRVEARRAGIPAGWLRVSS